MTASNDRLVGFRGMVLRVAAGLLALWTVGIGQVRAQPADYAVDSDRWNGLDQFVRLGEALGTPIEHADRLKYGSLRPTDTLVIVYPRTELDVRALAEFVIDGGRILLADDFGRAGPLLKRLDIDREPFPGSGTSHEEFVREKRSLPVFTPGGVHPLLEGVEIVVGNHPTLLRHEGGAVVGYEGGGGAVYDMNLGEGKVVVFGDASLLINHMLGVADNRQLVANALRYLCENRSECSPRLFVGSFEQEGTYRSGREGERSVAWFAERFNQLVDEIQRQVPSRPLLFYLSLILAAGLVVYLATVFSVRESRRYSEYIEEAVQEVPAPQTEFEWNVSRFGADRRETNFALPLAILKEVFEEIVYEELGRAEPPREEGPSAAELAREIRDERLQDRDAEERERLERQLRDLLVSYESVPTRHRVFLDSDAYFSDRDLIQLYRRTKEMLDELDLEEEYERRTRTLV